MIRDSARDYEERGPLFQRAWEVLARGCEVPPSIEVFDAQLADAHRANPDTPVIAVARHVADTYHRVSGFGDG